MSSSSFEDTVKNLFKMKPKPHNEAPAAEKDQSESDAESSKERNKR